MIKLFLVFALFAVILYFTGPKKKGFESKRTFESNNDLDHYNNLNG